MIRRLSIRAKLALLVTVPLVALVVVTVPGILTRIDEVRAEGRAHDLAAGPAADLAATVAAVQDEAALSTWFAATADPEVRARLATARETVDRRIDDLPEVRDAADAAGASETARRVARLERSVALLTAKRTEVDNRTATDDSVVDTYGSVADAAVRALDAAAAAPDDAVASANLRDTATLVRMADASAEERAIVLAAFSRGELSDNLANRLAAAVATQSATLQTFLGQAGPELRGVQARRARASTTSTAVEAMRNQALARQYTGTQFTPAQWYDTASQHVQELFDTADGARARTQALAETRKQQALEEALLYVGLAVVAFLLTAALTIAIARAIVRPLRRLTRAAREVSQRQLPHLVDVLRHEDARTVPEIKPIEVDSRDEIGELAAAFNDIEATTETVAREQRSVLQKGIGDLYLNLARRNQSLLERQFGVIDELELDEEDPERLDALFRLDHLATRMRRNAESLLVLAGIDEVRPHGAPVAMHEVVRGALSEIVDYARVDVVGVSERLSVRADIAVDLSHVIAELLENAASFSPPQSRIFVTGERHGADYDITISDEGIGIPPERVAELNQLLANPPLPGLQLSRSLGLVVVARLAARMGTRVRLRSAPQVGTSAIITVPADLLVDKIDPSARIAAAAAAAEAAATQPATPPVPTEPTPAPAPVPAEPAAPVPAEPAADATPDETILPRTSRVARRRARSRRGRRGRTPAPPSERAAVAEAPGPVTAAAAGDVTSAGLPRRVPTTPEADAPQDAPPLAPNPRPPDQVFELVARFEAGRRRVHGEPEPGAAPELAVQPPDAQGTDVQGTGQPEETP